MEQVITTQRPTSHSGTTAQPPSAIVLTAEHPGLTVTVVPRSGARIAQITDAAGRNWLIDTGRAEPNTDRPIAFAEGTRGGWDECLPSIVSCTDPNSGRAGSQIADHGDFWARPWTVQELLATEVVLDSGDVHHSLRIRKTIRLRPGRPGFEVRLDVHNRSERAYRFLYSAHPLWAWSNTAEIELPGATEVRTGFGQQWPEPLSGSWPLLSNGVGDPVDLSTVSRTGKPTNYKVFVRWAGHARLSFPALRSAVELRQSSQLTPWLGICVNRDAWPAVGAGESWIAIEPTTAPTDSLLEAVMAGTDQVLEPGQSLSWTSSIEIVQTATLEHIA